MDVLGRLVGNLGVLPEEAWLLIVISIRGRSPGACCSGGSGWSK